MTTDVIAVGPTASPWARGQLPSPWADGSAAAHGGAAPVAPPPPAATQTFAEVLSRTQAMAGGLADEDRVPGIAALGSAAGMPLADRFGAHSIESLGKRLSKADSDLAQSVNNLQNLDPSSPDLNAELLSVNLLSAKGSVTSMISMKFASKVNEAINTLLKTN